MKRILVLLIIGGFMLIPLILPAQSVEPVIVVFKNGYTVKGTVFENNEQHLTLKLTNGRLISYQQSTIDKIQSISGAKNGSLDLIGRKEGLILGLNISRPSSKLEKYADNIKGTVNLSLGAIVLMPYTEKVSFQGELHLLRKGFIFKEKIGTQDYVHKAIETFLQVPILINFNLLAEPKIAVIAGPSVGFLVKTSYSHLFEEHVLEAGVHLGLQYSAELKNNMHAVARIKWENSLFRHNYRMNALSFGVGLLF